MVVFFDIVTTNFFVFASDEFGKSATGEKFGVCEKRHMVW